MIFFWFILAIVFLIAELMTLTFGYIFITIGAVVISLLLNIGIIADNDLAYQVAIMLFFCVLSFFFFYRSFKKSKENVGSGFKEDMNAIVIDNDLISNKEGKIKWSGSIFNAIIDEKSNLKKISIGSNVIIKEFKGNVAIVDKINDL